MVRHTGVRLGLEYETPSSISWQRANKKTPLSVEQVEDKLATDDYDHVAERKDIYMEAFSRSPETFAQTFGIIENMEAEGVETRVGFGRDADNNEHFAAIFNNTFGSGLKLLVSDGGIIIDNIEGMTHEQYIALARFCWMNSLNVQFPDNIDDNFKTQFNNAKSEYSTEMNMRYQAPSDEEESETTDAVEQERLADEAARAAAEQLPEEERADFIFNERRRRAEERMSRENASTDFDKIKKRMKTFTKRIGKKEGETIFSHQAFWSGALVYRMYKDADSAKKDGKMQKGGGYAKTYEIEIRFNFDKKGTLNATWGTPNDAPIPREYADEMVGILKSSGSNYIRFEQPMNDKDKGTFREVCAMNGVIPLGFNLNKHHVNKMINAASGTLTSNDLLDYKARMAKQLRRQLQENDIPFNSTKNDLRETIIKLENEVAGTPRDHRYIQFHDAYSGIKKHLHEVVRHKEDDGRPDAVKVVAAAEAFCEFFDVYEENCDKSVSEFLQSGALNLPSERQQFLQQTGLTENSSTKLMDLDKEQLVILYKCMIPEQEAKARTYFETQFSDPNRDISDSDFVKDTLKNTMENMRDKAYALKDSGGGDIYLESLGSPKYHGPVVARHQGGRNNYRQLHQQRNQRY